ncbi:MAG: lysophospholipid acyltransferase family protein [Bacteroidota bacterium]|nr:lysophospholipid acyltransferase family protein [Bacteroidota bacterium]
MKVWFGITRAVYFVYAVLWFVIFTLAAFPLVIVFSLFGKITGGNLICRLVWVWADCWYFLIGIRHQNLFESHCDPAKTYVFVSNHISYLDIPCIFKSIRKQPFRVLAKADLKKIPVFGYIYSRGAVMVDRSSTTQRAQSVRELKKILGHRISVFIFPEGTFNETGDPLKSFYDGAFRISIQTQTPIKPVLFLDNYSLMNYRSVFSLKPGKSRVIFLEEISPEGFTLTGLNLFKEHVYRLMDQRLRDHQAAWIGCR